MKRRFPKAAVGQAARMQPARADNAAKVGLDALSGLLKATPARAPAWAYVATIAAVLVVTVSFVWVWRFGYTCDHAISGLMAKSILRRGERPLFLWTLGYNGILLESYAIACFYWLFGHGPRVYYLFTLLCFWGLNYALFRHAARYLGQSAALMAVLFYAISSPRVYFYVLRPQPNYTEIFLLGLILLHLADVLAQRLVRPSAAGGGGGAHGAKEASIGRSALWLGLCVGFSLYTYQLILFFIGALVLHTGAIFFADLRARTALCPPERAKMRRAAIVAMQASALCLLPAPLLFFLADEQSAAQQLARPLFVGGTGLLVGAAALEFCLVRTKSLRHYARASALFLAGAIAGYSPSLYFTYVLHGASRDRLRVSLSPSQVKQSFWLFAEAQRRFVNAWDSSLGIALGLIVFAAVAWAVTSGMATLWRGMRHRAPSDALFRVSPLLLMPLVSVPLFCFAAAAEDWESARWTIGLSLVFAFAQAWAWQRCWSAGAHVRAAGSALAAAILLHNGWCLTQALNSPEAKSFRGEELVAELKQREVTRAYADYWYAYSIDLFTDESIIIEPLYNNYSPHYGATVRAASRVAIIDQVGPRLRHVPQQVRIGNADYRKTDAWFGKQAGFVVLERLPG